MAKKKVYNINEMHKVLVIAHNSGNKKAINADMVAGAQVENSYFIKWQADVRALQETCWDYVKKRKNQRFDATITDADIQAARERIYPKWKQILESGEADKYAKQLKVSESDVEDLIGFAWDFMGTRMGTAECSIRPDVFRRKVESLLGCAIAKNAVLDDTERETLDTYYKAVKRVQTCIDTMAELKISKDNYSIMLADAQAKNEEQFVAYIGRKISEIDEQLKALAEAKLKAEATETEYCADAKSIENKMKWAV